MVDIKKPPVDAVLVGFGWTGAIMGMELTVEFRRVLYTAKNCQFVVMALKPKGRSERKLGLTSLRCSGGGHCRIVLFSKSEHPVT